MKFLYEDKIICVCCHERVRKNDMKIICDRIGICKICNKRLLPIPEDSPFEGTPDVDYILSAYYYNDILKKLIHRYKFNCEYKLGELFAGMLYERMKNLTVLNEFDFITAVPLSRKRFLIRSFNQAELIAKCFSEACGIPYISCIYRSKNTLAQSGLRARDRVSNIANAFIADKNRVCGKHILLFDDIFTTGSTMNSCAHELKDKGALSVAGMSFAKVINR